MNSLCSISGHGFRGNNAVVVAGVIFTYTGSNQSYTVPVWR